MALWVAKWTDKQLDELKDMLSSADSSKAALFVIGGFLGTGNKVMTDDTETTLTVSENAPPDGGVHISPGVFIHNNIAGENKAGQLDSTQLVNIISDIGGWGGPGLAAGAAERWDLICVANAEKSDYPENRWFVDDVAIPNTYAENLTDTLINKAYYDIQVVHCTPGAGFDQPVPPGYFCIAEVLVPPGAVTITDADIFDTTGLSYNPAPSWDASTRVLRLEYGASVFRVDHDPLTGFHRVGAWHIGSVVVTATGTEINQALNLIGATVTAANLTKLTDNSVLPAGTLHSHTGGPQQYIHMTEEFATGSTGFDITHKVWTARRLNVTRCDDTGSVSLAGYQFRLPAGTYILDAIASTHGGGAARARLYNVTDAGIMPNGQTDTSGKTMVGGAVDSETGGASSGFSHVRGKFIIAGVKWFELQIYTQSAAKCGDAGGGDGVNPEVWAEVVLWKC